jgi:hypothetical protein
VTPSVMAKMQAAESRVILQIDEAAAKPGIGA